MGVANRSVRWAGFARTPRCLCHGMASVALALFAASAWGAEPLFIPLDEADASRYAPSVAVQPAGKAQAAQERLGDEEYLVRIDRQRLFQTIHAIALSGPVSVVLNMADDFEIEVLAERARRTLSGRSLSGRVVGARASAMTFAVNGEVLVGTVWTPNTTYEIFPLKDGVHVFRKADPSAALPEGDHLAHGHETKRHQTKQGSADDAGGAVVDILVVWTPKARENIESIGGGEAEIRTGIDFLVAWTNDAYERSGAEVRLNLVGAEEIDYVEEDIYSETHFSHLVDPADGFMDGVHERRDALGADLVSLLPGVGTVGGKGTLEGAFSLAVLGLDPSVVSQA